MRSVWVFDFKGVAMEWGWRAQRCRMGWGGEGTPEAGEIAKGGTAGPPGGRSLPSSKKVTR